MRIDKRFIQESIIPCVYTCIRILKGYIKNACLFFQQLSSAACLATLCSSGTAKVSLFMLPLAGRLRFMIFVAVFCLLITALLLFLDISHVVYFFPLNWARLVRINIHPFGTHFFFLHNIYNTFFKIHEIINIHLNFNRYKRKRDRWVYNYC